MDQISLVSSIYEAVIHIDSGRKGFVVIGKEREGRINYELDISNAMAAFQQASNHRFATSADPQILILAEWIFLRQELQLCDKTDKDSINSLTKAIQNFDDAFLALQAVEEIGYKTAEKHISMIKNTV